MDEVGDWVLAAHSVCKSELENNVWPVEFYLELTPKYGIREAY